MKPTPEPYEPLWLPPGVNFSRLPKSVQDGVREMIDPLYQEYVRNAPGLLERTTGLSLVNLAWLELLDQAKLAASGSDPHPDAVEYYHKGLDRHLRLINSKERVCKFLLIMEEFKKKNGGKL